MGVDQLFGTKLKKTKERVCGPSEKNLGETAHFKKLNLYQQLLGSGGTRVLYRGYQVEQNKPSCPRQSDMSDPKTKQVQPCQRERLYLPRAERGRGLQSVEQVREREVISPSPRSHRPAI